MVRTEMKSAAQMTTGMDTKNRLARQFVVFIDLAVETDRQKE
jgi:hypothetical protein